MSREGERMQELVTSSVSATSSSSQTNIKPMDNYYLTVEPVERRLRVRMFNPSQSESFYVLHKFSPDEIERYGVCVPKTQNWDDDDYICCEECRKYYRASCLDHPLYWVADRVVPSGQEKRAEKTLPAFLRIRKSSIPEAGSGVFANIDIPVGLVFGPYQGVVLEDAKDALRDGYSWEIKHSDRTSVYIDGSDVSQSNWMRYINSSRVEAEQNMIAFQCNGSIYYKVYKPIDINAELLVWYGHKFGESLGVHRVHSSKKIKSRHPFIY